MKKILNVLLIVILVIPTFSVPTVVHAETLGDVKNQLAKSEEEYKQNKNQKALTESEIASVNSSITSLEKQVEQTYIDISNLDKEIEKLNNDITEKEKEIKEIISFIQVSNGESAYLEYAFGAKDFTDFIYRVAVAEQLTDYNETLIEQYNNDIKTSKQKQQEFREKQVKLADQKKELDSKRALLGEQLQNLDAVAVDINETIQYQKEVIELYKSKGCTDNQTLADCDRQLLPAGTAFYRPTESGMITSEWGPRDLLGHSWHEGIDIGIGVGTTVYSVGNGMVASIVRYNCGGNIVIVYHNIKGKTYTSVYAHLSSVSVTEGQDVTRNTVIGYSGGAAGGYDQCTTGPHLHVTIATGLFLRDYNNWTYELNQKYSINPRTVINFPSGLYNRWSDRVTAY